MWKRIQYYEWADIIPYLAFFLTFGVFIVMSVRAVRLRRDQALELAKLPLEDSPATKPQSEHDIDSSR